MEIRRHESTDEIQDASLRSRKVCAITAFCGLAVIGTINVLSYAVYIIFEYESIADRLLEKKDRYLGSPAVRAECKARRERILEIDNITRRFNASLKEECSEGETKSHIVEHIKQNHGTISFERIKEEAQASAEAEYGFSTETAKDLTSLMEEVDTYQPRCLLQKGAELGQKRVREVFEAHERRQWVKEYGEGLTEEQISRAGEDPVYKWRLECSIRAKRRRKLMA